MNAKELLRAIRLVIKEEVRKTIQSELREFKQDLREQQNRHPAPRGVIRKPIVKSQKNWGSGAMAKLLAEADEAMRNGGDSIQPDLTSMYEEPQPQQLNEGEMMEQDYDIPEYQPSFHSSEPGSEFLKDYSGVLNKVAQLRGE